MSTCAYEAVKERTLVLITKVPLATIADVHTVYDDRHRRGRIEHAGAHWARFDQEQGLDVEDMRVQTLERMKRLFILVLATAQFVFFLIDTWPPSVVCWLRSLGSKLGLQNDLDGPYLVLRGLFMRSQRWRRCRLPQPNRSSRLSEAAFRRG